MDQVEQPHILSISEYHLSREKARSAVIAVLEQLGLKKATSGDWDSAVVTNRDTNQRYTFRELVDETRRTGVVGVIQSKRDFNDGVFGGTFDAHTPNANMSIGSEYAGRTFSAQGPCRSSRVEIDLMEDILYYREQTCRHSNEYTFKLTARYFRAYLSACVSIVDAFINRHVCVATYDGFESDELTALRAETNMEKKLRLWKEMCSEKPLEMLTGSVEWNSFQELRTKRNEIIHVLEPLGFYSLREMQVYLNKVREGVGGLMRLMRKLHKKETTLFIERLRTAPLVSFNEIRFRADGRHVVKMRQAQAEPREA